MARQSRPKGEPGKPGRPRLIDQPCPVAPGKTYAESIIDFVRLGVPLAVAARSSGIAEDTFNEWRARGRGTHVRDDPDGRFARFAQDVDIAEAESVARLVLALREAVVGDPYTVTRTVTKMVRDEGGRLVPATETTRTEGVKRYPRTAEWLLQRRAPEYFGVKAAEQPAPGLPDPNGGDEADDAFQAAWDAYQKGRRDERDDPVVVEDPGANGASSV